MKTVALEAITADAILWFCENAAELGCPKKKEVDMWYRYLSPKEQFKVAEKLLDIIDRDTKRFEEKKNDKVESCKVKDKCSYYTGKGNNFYRCRDYFFCTKKDQKKDEPIPFCPKCNKKKVKTGVLVGCKSLTKEQWESGLNIDSDKMFSQKNCPLLVKGKK